MLNMGLIPSITCTYWYNLLLLVLSILKYVYCQKITIVTSVLVSLWTDSYFRTILYTTLLLTLNTSTKCVLAASKIYF